VQPAQLDGDLGLAPGDEHERAEPAGQPAQYLDGTRLGHRVLGTGDHRCEGAVVVQREQRPVGGGEQGGEPGASRLGHRCRQRHGSGVVAGDHHGQPLSGETGEPGQDPGQAEARGQPLRHGLLAR